VVHSLDVIDRTRQRREPSPPGPAIGIAGDIGRQRWANAPGGPAAGVDRAIARLATRQQGVVTRRQLIGLGLSAAAIDHRVRTSRLLVVHRGVYAVGHQALTDLGRMRAALMAAGPSAVRSHTTAAVVWNLLASLPPFVEVTVTRKGPRSRQGLVVHETRRQPEVRTIDSLPVTAPLRTLLDLSATQPPRRLERLCAEALVLKLVTQEQLDAARVIDPALAAPTRSKFERTFLASLRRAGLPRPLVGHRIAPYTADFAWPAERVVVETDGWGSTGTAWRSSRTGRATRSSPRGGGSSCASRGANCTTRRCSCWCSWRRRSHAVRERSEREGVRARADARAPRVNAGSAWVNRAAACVCGAIRRQRRAVCGAAAADRRLRVGGGGADRRRRDQSREDDHREGDALEHDPKGVGRHRITEDDDPAEDA